MIQTRRAETLHPHLQHTPSRPRRTSPRRAHYFKCCFQSQLAPLLLGEAFPRDALRRPALRDRNADLAAQHAGAIQRPRQVLRSAHQGVLLKPGPGPQVRPPDAALPRSALKLAFPNSRHPQAFFRPAPPLYFPPVCFCVCARVRFPRLVYVLLHFPRLHAHSCCAQRSQSLALHAQLCIVADTVVPRAQSV